MKQAEDRMTEITNHYIEMYGEICYELEYAMCDFDKGRDWLLPATLEEDLAQIEWIFECEWDDSIAGWHSNL